MSSRFGGGSVLPPDSSPPSVGVAEPLARPVLKALLAFLRSTVGGGNRLPPHTLPSAVGMAEPLAAPTLKALLAVSVVAPPVSPEHAADTLVVWGSATPLAEPELEALLASSFGAPPVSPEHAADTLVVWGSALDGRVLATLVVTAKNDRQHITLGNTTTRKPQQHDGSVTLPPA